MLKHVLPLLLILTGLSVLSGYLLSRASVIGRAGIDLFYREYHFLKVWWQAGAVVLGTLLIVLLLHEVVRRLSSRALPFWLHLLLLLLAFGGLYLTYTDFRETLSHRALGSRFHIGAYLFWLGWIFISFYYLLKPKKGRK